MLLYFEFYTKYYTTSEISLLLWKSVAYLEHSKSSQNIFSVKHLNPLVKSTASSSDVLIFLRQLIKVDTITLGFSKVEVETADKLFPVTYE